ncbi:MAG: carbohydrate porin [Planctomycetota bacterium]
MSPFRSIQSVGLTALLLGTVSPAQEAATAPAVPVPATQPSPPPATQPAGPPALNYRGDWWSRPALTGDWFGGRNWLSERGVRFDAQVIQYLQGNAHGGRSTNSAIEYSGTADYALNFDFQKMGLWPGGFARIRAETKFGQSVNRDVGSVSSPNFNSLLPLPGDPGLTTLTEYWIMQFVSEKLGFIAGQVDLTGLPGQNRFASDRYAHFLNTSFWQNPVAFTTVPYSTMTAGAIYAPTKWFDGATLVCDSYGTATRSGFSEGFHAPQAASIIQGLNFHIAPFGRSGTQRLNFSYSTRPRYPLEDVDRLLLSGVAPPVVDRVLLSRALGLDTQHGWVFWYDFDQYLFTEADDPNQGWGVFGRFGWSPGEVNPVESFYSIGVGGTGVIPTRDRDRFGLGYYMLNFTDELPGLLQANAEQGVELFYNIELTPWLHITPDIQVIVAPGGNTGAREREPAIVYGLRMQMNF